MASGPGTYGSKRGRPPLSGKEKAQASAKKRIVKKKVEAKKTAVKKAVKSAATSAIKGAKDVVKTARKVAQSKRVRAGLKAGASSALGLTAARALKKRAQARKKK